MKQTAAKQGAALPRTVERFLPSQVLWAGSPNLNRDSHFLQKTLAELHIPIVPVQIGHVLDLGDEARLEVLATRRLGGILQLTWENFRLLLLLGLDFEGMEDLSMGDDIGPVTALLLADSGYGPLNSPDWIANLNPQLILHTEAGGHRATLNT